MCSTFAKDVGGLLGGNRVHLRLMVVELRDGHASSGATLILVLKVADNLNISLPRPLNHCQAAKWCILT